MDEDVLAAIVRLNEAKAFLAIEPLHGSLRHRMILPLGACIGKLRANAAGYVRVLGEGRQSGAQFAARPSRSAEARSTVHRALLLG